MNLYKTLSYLKEELSDIPAEAENIHYTNLFKLYKILESGKLNGVSDYFVTTNISDIKGRKPELCTIRKRNISDKARSELSYGASGGVKFSLFTKRIMTSIRGVKKEPIAEAPKLILTDLKNTAKEFKKDYKLDLPFFVDRKSDFNKVNPWTMEIKDVKKSKVPEIVKAWDFVQKHNLDAKAITLILVANRLLVSYYKQVQERETEERFILPDGLPIDPKYMTIEIISNSGKGDNRSVKQIFDKQNAKKFLDLLNEYQDCFVKNKNYKDLIEELSHI